MRSYTNRRKYTTPLFRLMLSSETASELYCQYLLRPDLFLLIVYNSNFAVKYCECILKNQ